MMKLRNHQISRGWLVAAAILLLPMSANAQRAFETPEEAATALAAAVKSGATSDLMKVLGSGC
jgi:hypothetical protein